MVAIIGEKATQQFDASALQMKDRTVVVGNELDDGGWRMGEPFSRVHKAGLFAVIHGNAELARLRAYYEPNLNEEQQKKQYEVGIFDVDIAKWHIRLNWTPRTVDKGIPARHIAVAWKGEPIGVIGPYATIRTCWCCGLEGYRDEALTIPNVVPGRGCPRCNTLDWWGQKGSHVINPGTGQPFNISQEHFQMDCEHFIRQATDDREWTGFNPSRTERAIKRAAEA